LMASSYSVMISPPSSWVSNSFRVSEVDVELRRTGAGGL